MTKVFIATLFIILPAVFSASTEKKEGRSLVLGPQASGLAATAATGLNYGQQNAASETHDKKNFGVNFSSDRGSSNQFSNTGLQAAATGGLAQGQGYPPYTYPQYPYYPSYYPYYPQYPVYPNYGVGAPNVGSGSSVQLPGVSAGSVAGVTSGQYPIRY